MITDLFFICLHHCLFIHLIITLIIYETHQIYHPNCWNVFALSSFGNTSEDPLKIVQKSILEDPLMEQVSRMAHHTVSTGLNAGDGYGEVWIRDFNTFIQVAMDVMPDQQVQECLNTFFIFREKVVTL